MRVLLTAIWCVAVLGGGGCTPSERVTVPDTEASGFLAVPEGSGPFPAVVLMHGCSGLDPEVRKGNQVHVRHLVSEGFVALVLDSFGPRRLGDVVCNEGDEMWAAYRYRQRDAVSALRFLRSQPFVDRENIFVMGQSHGGEVVLRLARSRTIPVGDRFRAAVAYYPWCGNQLREERHTPVLVLIGEHDDWTPAFHCVEGQGYARGAPFEEKGYPSAHHSFDLPMGTYRYKGHTVAGNPAAAADSRARMVAWFRQHGTF
ncbi:MAG: dienelactone hydrolase family protein [Rhodospirillales bacterium]|nr:dienelactone hydrolase family protein [Rhodospirillales bacterium]